MANYLIELSVIHFVLVLGYGFFLRNERQYAKMRFYLLGSAVLALIIPIFKLPRLFNGEKPIYALPADTIPMENFTIPTAAETSSWNDEILLWIYIAVSLFFLIKLLISLCYLFLKVYKSSVVEVNGIRVRKTKIRGSFTFFHWIFLSKEMVSESQHYEAILNHEKAHASLGHTYDLIFIESLKVCFWWVPTIWFIHQEIKKIHEYQADAYALKSSNIDQYSSILIHSAIRSYGLALASSFHDGLIFKRLNAMKEQVKNVSPWKIVTLSSMIVVLFIVCACTEETHTEDIGEPFNVVEQQAEFVGGMDAFYRYVTQEMTYPLEARQSGVEGKVFVQFVVEKDGSLSQVEAVKGIGAGCDEEAERVLRKSPAFTPGKQRGKPVRVRMVMPVLFKLDQEQVNPDNSPQGIIVVEKVDAENGQLKVDASYTNGEWSGIVYSPEGDVLPGANVMVSGTSKGTVTDLDGSFKVKANKSNELNISFVGYKGVNMTHIE